jgi:hypothetical protein
MTAPALDHCNICHRDVLICASCGKPSCVGGKTQCHGCEQARALDDRLDALMTAHREDGREITYADLLAVKGTS